MLIGVDDIPSRWRAQAAAPGWIGVAATSHFEVVVSEHTSTSPCAGFLRGMLEEQYEWRRIATLARAVGASEEKTRELLISIDARASTTGGDEAWGLIARVGTTGTREVDPDGQTDVR